MKLTEREFPLFGIVHNGEPLVMEPHGSVVLFEGEVTLYTFCRLNSEHYPNAVVFEMQGQPALVRHLIAAQQNGGKQVVWNPTSLDFQGRQFSPIKHLLDQLTGPDSVAPPGERLQMPAQLLLEDDGETPRVFVDDRGLAIPIFESEARMAFAVQALDLGTVARATIASATKLVRYLEIWAENNSRAGWVLMQPFMDYDGELDFAQKWPLDEFLDRIRKHAAEDTAASN